jgi:ParB family chromosome partitioning protein
VPDTGADLGSQAEDLPDFLAGEDETPADDEDDEQHSVAAE